MDKIISTKMSKVNMPQNECDICAKNSEVHNTCCNVSVCFACDYKFLGKCCVCDRVELNEKCGNCFYCGKTVETMNYERCGACKASPLCTNCVEVSGDFTFWACCNSTNCIEAYHQDDETKAWKIFEIKDSDFD